MRTDDLYLMVRGREISGWEEIEVTLRCEGFPNSFQIGLSVRDPVHKGAVLAAAGDGCEVRLGDDLVISGYIDRDISSGDARGHNLKLVGRGKCCDLVDCSAVWPTGQMVNGNALTIAQSLAQAYKLEVKLAAGASPGGEIVQRPLNYGETGASIVQSVAQNAGLLAYEDATGALVLATVGAEAAASGITYGLNVESWSIQSAMDQRYSDIVCCSFSMDVLAEIPGSDFYHTENDPNVRRPRQLDIPLVGVAENAHDFTIRKAKWELARRAGRGTIISATVDSWRDSAGNLWKPNTLVPVDLPGLRVTDTDLCLSEVTFRRSNEGTHAEMLLMPKEAFSLEPIVLIHVNTLDLDEPRVRTQ